jgi:DNA helicase II / ATP-dependent DNA helicase PcrA
MITLIMQLLVGVKTNYGYTTLMSNLFNELNEKQIQAVQATEGPVLILAGAGSGKTKTLTHRIAYLISEKGVLPHHILAVTFTNKAAGELRNRAAKLLRQNPKTWVTWRGFGSSPALGTFHSICVRILREQAGRLGYKQSFVIYDTSDQKSAMKQVMRREGISTKDVNPSTVLGMVSRAKNELLSPEEMEKQARGPVEKIASQLYGNYQRYLKANDAMDFDDLLMLCVILFQKFPEVLSQYQERWHYIMIDEYQDTNHVQYEWARLLAGKPSSLEGRLQNIFVVGDDWQGIYSWRGATIRNILEFEKDFAGALVIRLEQNYRSTSDIVELGNSIIAGNSGQMKKKLWTKKHGEHVPEVWQVRDEVREAEMILEKINVIASDQAERHSEYPKGRKLHEEFRESRSNINQRDPLTEFIPSTLGTQDDEVVYDYEAEGNGKPGPSHKGGTGILDKILSSMKGGKSSKRVDAIRAPSGVPFDIGQQRLNWNDFAVLYRTNAQSRALEEVLLKYGVPYRLIGGIRFYERKEIKDTLSYLRFLLNPNDAISLSRIINEPSRGIGEKTLSKIQELARKRNESILSCMLAIEDVSDISAGRIEAIKKFALVFERALKNIDTLSVVEIIDLVLARSGYLDYLKAQGDEGEERIENIEELKNVAKKFEVIKGLEGLEAFLEEVSLITDIDTYDPETGQALTLMTLHAAKGLEFETVFMVGLEEGLLPHSNSLIEPAQLEEERRLCYVGITRAQNRLYIIHARQRALHGSIVGNIPSRFLSELGDEHVQFFDEDKW